MARTAALSLPFLILLHVHAGQSIGKIKSYKESEEQPHFIYHYPVQPVKPLNELQENFEYNKFDVRRVNPLNAQVQDNRNSEEDYKIHFLERNTLPHPLGVPGDDASRSLTGFGLKFLKAIDSKDNVVVSPFSTAIILALLQQGAMGQTLTQINEALLMSPQKSIKVVEKILETIQNRNSRNILKVATCTFPSSEVLDMNQDYIQTSVNKFGSNVIPLYYQQVDLAAKVINAWIAKHTSNIIRTLVSGDSLSPDTQLVIVNGIVFKGIWKKAFDPRLSCEGVFTLRDGKTKQVSYMHTTDKFLYKYDSQIQAKVVALPFEGSFLSIIIILPDESTDLNSVISRLNIKNLEDTQRFPEVEVKLSIPKFSIRSNLDMKPILQKVGLTHLFGPSANLSRIGHFGDKPLVLTTAVQSAFLAIDEKGGVAAAATLIAAVPLSIDFTEYFKVDRPFLAVLWDNQLKYPLFMAKVENPIV